MCLRDAVQKTTGPLTDDGGVFEGAGVTRAIDDQKFGIAQPALSS